MTDKISKLFNIPVLFLLLIYLAGCSDKIPTLPQLAGDDVILAFGNSLTYGTGAKKNESYPAVLESLTSLKVVNAGIPGELSGEGLNRLPEELDKYNPKLLILCHGGNDLLRKQSKTQLIENLSEMIVIAQERGINVILMGVPEPKLIFMETAPLYSEIAKKFNIPIENNIIAVVEKNQKLKSDSIHPNALGYHQIAQAIFILLRKTGTI